MSLPDWAFSPLFLAAALLLLAALRLPRPGADAASPLTWRDGLLALGCGFTVALIASQVLSVAYLSRCGVTAPDLEEFCATVHGLRSRSPGWVVRQPGAGLLPSSLSIVSGFMDGLSQGALISSFMIGVGHYLGGRLLLGPLAGLAAALLGLTLAPLAVLTGHMTFYPEATAGFLLALVSGVYLLQRPGFRGLTIAGLGVGLGLMVDFVGLLLTAPIILIAGFIALQAPGWRRRAMGLALFCAPILLSFTLARAYTPRSMSGFEEEIQFYIQDVGGSIPLLGPEVLDKGGAAKLVDPVLMPSDDGDGLIYRLPRGLRAKLPPLHPNLSGESYIWGHTMPWELPKVLLRIALYSGTQQAPTQRFSHGERSVVEERQNQLTPILPLIVGGVVLTLFALRRKPWLALALVLMLLPFGLSLRYQAMTRVLPRFLMAPLVPFPILMGVGFAYITTRRKEGGAAWKGQATALVLTAFLALLILGVIPSHLSPKAPWRVGIESINAAMLQTRRLSQSWREPSRDPGASIHACEPVVRVDYAMGRDPWGDTVGVKGCADVGADSENVIRGGWSVEAFLQVIPGPASLKAGR